MSRPSPETSAGVLRVASIYLPNGNPVDSDKFGYKLGWMKRLERHAQELLALEEPTILGRRLQCDPQ